ncbi:MAG: HU family DNA-binding protein [Leptospirales bacterium]|nr:HU family DNA-binding protein [Leptospirales bacterium]
MTKTRIVSEICAVTKLNRKEVSKIIDIFLDKIKDSANEGRTVKIKGFGSFYNVVKKARQIHSPIAGRLVDVPEKAVLVFKSSKETVKEKGA